MSKVGVWTGRSLSSRGRLAGSVNCSRASSRPAGPGSRWSGWRPDELKQVSERLHTESAYWYADVTDHEAMSRVAAEVKERFGKVDIVVANAGVATGGPFVDSDPESWRRVIEVNLIGSAVTARAFLPVLTESRGYLLQIASLAAITPAPMMTAYCASKSGVEAYAHCLRGRGRLQGRPGGRRLPVVDRHRHGARGRPGRRHAGVAAAVAVAGRARRIRWGPPSTGSWRGSSGGPRHVYAQWWLRGMQGVRGYLPGLIGAVGQREIGRFSGRLQGMGTGLVGAGGAADEEARGAGAGRGSGTSVTERY